MPARCLRPAQDQAVSNESLVADHEAAAFRRRFKSEIISLRASILNAHARPAYTRVPPPINTAKTTASTKAPSGASRRAHQPVATTTPISRLARITFEV